jgi:hypothetical protein
MKKSVDPLDIVPLNMTEEQMEKWAKDWAKRHAPKFKAAILKREQLLFDIRMYRENFKQTKSVKEIILNKKKELKELYKIEDWLDKKSELEYK